MNTSFTVVAFLSLALLGCSSENNNDYIGEWEGRINGYTYLHDTGDTSWTYAPGCSYTVVDIDGDYYLDRYNEKYIISSDGQVQWETSHYYDYYLQYIDFNDDGTAYWNITHTVLSPSDDTLVTANAEGIILKQ